MERNYKLEYEAYEGVRKANNLPHDLISEIKDLKVQVETASGHLFLLILIIIIELGIILVFRR